MNKFQQIVGKLRGRSAAELRTRGTQLLNAFAERQGWSRVARVPDDQEFFEVIDSGFFPT
jgi:hypothetical protein